MMKKHYWHALFWVVIYILWSYMKSGGSFHPMVLKVNLINMVIYMTAYYSLRHYQLPKLYNRRRKTSFILSILFNTLVFYAVWRLVGTQWTDDIFYVGRKMPRASLVSYLTQSVQFYSPAVLLLAWEFYHTRQKEILRIEQLEKEKIATELKYLKAQINPHFLFNTLNNLYSFVINGSSKAPEMILQLSGMLDYVLYKSQQSTVPLQEEVKCLNDFIELEKTRYGDRLKVDYNVSGDLNRPISPLIFLSIVENAFKHGASGDISSPHIRINIEVNDSTINCIVWNTKSPYQGELNDAYKEGIGMSNIKKQLSLIYPDRHDINIDESEAHYEITVSIYSER